MNDSWIIIFQTHIFRPEIPHHKKVKSRNSAGKMVRCIWNSSVVDSEFSLKTIIFNRFPLSVHFRPWISILPTYDVVSTISLHLIWYLHREDMVHHEIDEENEAEKLPVSQPAFGCQLYWLVMDF